MVKIPRRDREERYQHTPQPFSTGDSYAKPGLAKVQLGKAYGDLGNAIGNAVGSIGGEMQAKQSAQNSHLDQIEILRWTNAVNMAELEYRHNYAQSGGDGTGYADSRASWFGTMSQELLGNVSSEGQQRAALHIERMRGQFGLDAKQFEYNHRDQFTYKTTEGGITSEAAKLAQKYSEVDEFGVRKVPDPALAQREFMTVMQGIDQMINSYPGTPKQKEALRKHAAEQLRPFLSSLPISADPDAYRSMMEQLWKAQPVAPEQGISPPITGQPNTYPGGQPIAPPRTPFISKKQQSSLKGVRAPLQQRLAALQGALGYEFGINSGYRDPVHNRKVDGVTKSQHLYGNAVDLDVSGLSREQRINVIRAASALGFGGIGVYRNSIHLDIGGRRAWGPSRGSESIPLWAKGALDDHVAGRTTGRVPAPMQAGAAGGGSSSGLMRLGGPSPSSITAMPRSGQNIDPAAFMAVAEQKIAASPLNGFVPRDGAMFGIKTGSPREWARFFAMITKQESGFRIALRNADGSLARFATTLKSEKSFGPGQFNKGEYGLKSWDDVNNPDRVIDAYIEVAKSFTMKSGNIRGNNKGMDAYFGSIRRPNEVLQHASWAANLAPGEGAPTPYRADVRMPLGGPGTGRQSSSRRDFGYRSANWILDSQQFGELYADWMNPEDAAARRRPSGPRASSSSPAPSRSGPSQADASPSVPSKPTNMDKAKAALAELADDDTLADLPEDKRDAVMAMLPSDGAEDSGVDVEKTRVGDIRHLFEDITKGKVNTEPKADGETNQGLASATTMALDVVKVKPNEQAEEAFSREQLSQLHDAGIDTQGRTVREVAADASRRMRERPKNVVPAQGQPADPESGETKPPENQDQQTFDPMRAGATPRTDSTAGYLLEGMLKNWGAVQATHAKRVTKLFDDVEKSAFGHGPGNSFRHPKLDELGEIVERMGDPALQQRYNWIKSGIELNEALATGKPNQISAVASAIRAQLGREATPEQIERLKMVEGLGEAAQQNLEKDSLSWAEKVGVALPTELSLETLKREGAEEALTARALAARATAEHFGTPFRMFKEKELNEFQSVLLKGGEDSMALLGVLHQATGDDLPQAIAQLSPKNPEFVVAARLVANNRNLETARTIVDGVSRRQDPNYKSFKEETRTTIEGWANDYFGDLVTRDQRQGGNDWRRKIDELKRSAELVAEMRNPNFDRAEYRKALDDVSGVAEVNGVRYGGFVKSGNSTILLPQNWPQDNWQELLDTLTLKDIQESGHPFPVTRSGRPVSATKLLNGTFVQMDDGKYLVSLNRATPGDEQYVMASPSQPYEPKAREGVKKVEQGQLSLMPMKPGDPIKTAKVDMGGVRSTDEVLGGKEGAGAKLDPLARQIWSAFEAIVGGENQEGYQLEQPPWKSERAAPLAPRAVFVIDLNALEPVIRRSHPGSFYGGR
jgi:hypothetical protein